MTPPLRPLRAADFDYTYPPELIAQHPTARREDSRLLVAERRSGTLTHRRFDEFPALLNAGDVLVVNTSRVVRARVRGTRASGAPAEVLLVHADADGTWLAMVHPGAKLKVGRRIRFGPKAGLEIVGIEADGLRRVRFTGALGAEAIMQQYGDVPLPPYIDRPPTSADRERYQTVYADRDGSVAAPTAGLHFSTELLDRVREAGVTVTQVVLHVGPGTFKPVEVDDPAQHVMHREWYEVSPAAADAINTARDRGGRVWAVGTTAARTLESAAEGGCVTAGSAWTDVFIYPPYAFRVVDALLTNFHLPRSTLLMLVAAFAGHDLTMHAYREAVARRYRLYSYGDAMAIV